MKKNRKYKKGKIFDLGDWFVKTNHKDDYSDLRKVYDVLIDTLPGCIEILSNRSKIHNGNFFTDKISNRVYQRVVELLYNTEPRNFLKEFNRVCRGLLSTINVSEDADYEGDRSKRHGVRTDSLIKKIIGRGSRYDNVAGAYEFALTAPDSFQRLVEQDPKHNHY
jgi:hypothetical protein